MTPLFTMLSAMALLIGALLEPIPPTEQEHPTTAYPAPVEERTINE